MSGMPFTNSSWSTLTFSQIIISDHITSQLSFINQNAEEFFYLFHTFRSPRGQCRNPYRNIRCLNSFFILQNRTNNQYSHPEHSSEISNMFTASMLSDKIFLNLNIISNSFPVTLILLTTLLGPIANTLIYYIKNIKRETTA